MRNETAVAPRLIDVERSLRDGASIAMRSASRERKTSVLRRHTLDQAGRRGIHLSVELVLQTGAGVRETGCDRGESASAVCIRRQRSPGLHGDDASIMQKLGVSDRSSQSRFRCYAAAHADQDGVGGQFGSFRFIAEASPHVILFLICVEERAGELFPGHYFQRQIVET